MSVFEEMTGLIDKYCKDEGPNLVASVDLPLVGRVITASSEQPYRSLSLELDGQMLSDLVTQIDLDIGAGSDSDRGLYVDQAGDALMDVVLRLMRLVDQKDDIAVMAPMLLQDRPDWYGR